MIRYLKIYVEISFTNEYAPYRTLFQYEKLYPLFYILCDVFILFTASFILSEANLWEYSIFM